MTVIRKNRTIGIKAWSNEEEEKLNQMYQEKTQEIEKIAAFFNKGHRSIISKLVNMGIYIKPEITKENSRTVKTMLRDIETILEIEIEGFNLNKKSNLLALVEALERKVNC